MYINIRGVVTGEPNTTDRFRQDLATQIVTDFVELQLESSKDIGIYLLLDRCPTGRQAIIVEVLGVKAEQLKPTTAKRLASLVMKHLTDFYKHHGQRLPRIEVHVIPLDPRTESFFQGELLSPTPDRRGRA